MQADEDAGEGDRDGEAEGETGDCLDFANEILAKFET